MWEEARSWRGAWRLRFNIPRSDPRYLDATDADMLDDLLVAMIGEAERRRESDPRAALLEDAERNPEAYAEGDAALMRSLQEGGTLFQLIRANEAAKNAPPPRAVVAVRPMRIRTGKEDA